MDQAIFRRTMQPVNFSTIACLFLCREGRLLSLCPAKEQGELTSKFWFTFNEYRGIIHPYGKKLTTHVL